MTIVMTVVCGRIKLFTSVKYNNCSCGVSVADILLSSDFWQFWMFDSQILLPLSGEVIRPIHYHTIGGKYLFTGCFNSLLSDTEKIIYIE